MSLATIQLKKETNIASVILTALLFFTPAFSTLGCSSHSNKTTTIETSRYPTAEEEAPQVIVREEKTTRIEEKEEHNDDRGVLSSAVHIVGEILALPFRAIAGLLGVLF